MAGERIERRLAAILAADVAGYSRLMGADEVGTLAALKALRREIVDPTIGDYKGRIVKTTGDGLLVEFASAVDAVTCAMMVQRMMAERNKDESKVRLRIGINVGDIIIDDGDIFGDGVNVAARVENECEPGGVCLSGSAFEQVRGKTGFVFDDLGERSLKNIDRAVRLYAVRPAGSTPHTSQGRIEPTKPLPLPDKPSIAVLPFQNMSGDPEQEYFADGMVEDIITGLSRFQSLFVIARNSSFVYKNKAVDLKQVGRELGVRYVLEGSIRKAAGRARITGQLIDTSTGVHIWADRFEASLDDIFKLQDDVTLSVIGAIAPRLLDTKREIAARRPIERWDCYDYYLQAVKLFHELTLPSTLRAQSLLQDAVKADPNFAPGYARLAFTVQVLRDQFSQPITEEQRVEALALAEKALSLSDQDEMVLNNVVYVFGLLAGDFERGRMLADRALSINPNNSYAWNARGIMSLVLGEPLESLDAFQRAMRLNPLDVRAVPLAMFGSSGACCFLGHFKEGVGWARKLLALQPHDFRGHFVILANLLGLGDEAAVEQTARQIRTDFPDMRSSAIRLAYRNRRPEFMAIIEKTIVRIGLPD